jgi:hypothetical protein
LNGLFIPFIYTPGAKGIHLRGLTGADEMSVGAGNTTGVLSLLRSLSQNGNNGNGFDAAAIVTADRDRVIARLYRSLYGAKIASTLACGGCGQKFDLDFSLDDLLAHCYPTEITIPDDGMYELEPGIRFRLPTGEDEMAVLGFDGSTAVGIMLERCISAGEPETSGESIQLKMAELAPVLSQEMQAVCPECDRVQKVLFDMQSFFMARLTGDRRNLLDEVHLIASHYHWSHRDILDLPRTERKYYAAMITQN